MDKLSIIGQSARNIRDALGLTVEQMADKLDMAECVVKAIEDGEGSEPPMMRYGSRLGIDLYCYAAAYYLDMDKMPVAMREAATALREQWKLHIEETIKSLKST